MFKGFSEGTLEFLPTYKYNPQSNQYVRSSWPHVHAVLYLMLHHHYSSILILTVRLTHLYLPSFHVGYCWFDPTLPPPLQVFFLHGCKETQGASVVRAMATLVAVIVCIFELCVTNRICDAIHLGVCRCDRVLWRSNLERNNKGTWLCIHGWICLCVW